MKFAFISEKKVAFPVAVLCRVLGVSASGYYARELSLKTGVRRLAE